MSYTTNTMTIGLDEMLLWLFYRISHNRDRSNIYIHIDRILKLHLHIFEAGSVCAAL